MKIIRIACVLLACFSTPVWAQSSDDWDWKIAPYLWTVGIDGTSGIGPIEQEVDISSAIS